MVPIWKDYTVRVNETAVYFRIITGGLTIYEGLASAKPGDAFVDIRINDICANYLKPEGVDFRVSLNSTFISRLFFLSTASSASGPWTVVDTVEFQADWSYDYLYSPIRDGFSFPISLFADQRQRLLVSAAYSVSISATLTFINGTSIDVSVPVRKTADFNGDFNGDYSKTNSSTTQGVAMLDLADYPGVTRVTMTGQTWNVDPHVCYRYALYYINAFGGWDALLCRGNGVESDSWDRKTYDTTYDNTVQQNRGTVDYINLQEKRWTLRTGWIPDGSRMHHLIGSTMVYLHDLQQDIILPVGVVTQEAPYKTYKNEGAKLVNYEFEVALQQERMRR